MKSQIKMLKLTNETFKNFVINIVLLGIKS